MFPEKIELANLLGGFSLAVDLAEGRPFQHAQDVSHLALRMGEDGEITEVLLSRLQNHEPEELLANATA